ncbi:unnamed protein product [Effrenium voratum]|nr:unnamed protein product [Effrenium voratum]
METTEDLLQTLLNHMKACNSLDHLIHANECASSCSTSTGSEPLQADQGPFFAGRPECQPALEDPPVVVDDLASFNPPFPLATPGWVADDLPFPLVRDAVEACYQERLVPDASKVAFFLRKGEARALSNPPDDGEVDEDEAEADEADWPPWVEAEEDVLLSVCSRDNYFQVRGRVIYLAEEPEWFRGWWAPKASAMPPCPKEDVRLAFKDDVRLLAIAQQLQREPELHEVDGWEEVPDDSQPLAEICHILSLHRQLQRLSAQQCGLRRTRWRFLPPEPPADTAPSRRKRRSRPAGEAPKQTAKVRAPRLEFQ